LIGSLSIFNTYIQWPYIEITIEETLRVFTCATTSSYKYMCETRIQVHT
jgi:hypothetical protein